MSGFNINLAVVKQGRSRVEARAAAADLDLRVEEWPSEIQGGFDVDRRGDQVTLVGKVSAVARLECVRCLRSFERPFEVGLTVLAERTGRAGRSEEDDLERDREMKFHDGRELDLREEAREALLLELPITARCSEDCKGLCPRCGTDLNQGPHQCPASP